MTTPTTKLPKAVSITFLVVNSLTFLYALWQIVAVLVVMPTVQLGVSNDKLLLVKTFSIFYAVIFFIGSTYALAVSSFIVAGKGRGFWMSGAIVSIIVGVLGMFSILWNVPAAIWLIVAMTKIRGGRNEMTTLTKP